MNEQYYEHHNGLAHDLEVMAHRALERRRMLGFFVSGGAALVLGGCGGAGGESGSDDTSASSSDSTAGSTNSGTATTDTSSTSGASGSTCIVDPTETEGPYPGDGSNRVNGSLVNVLAQSGVVRSDIRSSFGSLSGTAEGLPMTLKIAVVNVNNNCAPLTGYAVYLWHCTRGGEYSLYSSSIQNQNYLRGVQVTDSNGQCAFVSIFPGCYDGRWPHIHFELYQSANTAMSYSNKLLTSQMAMPMDISRAVYAAVSGYSASVSNLARISLASDNVFSDNTSEQIAWQTPTFTGDTTNGYTATITIGIAV